MRFCQVKEILEWVQAFHIELLDEYGRIKKETSDKRVLLLLEYLLDHERVLTESIANFGGKLADEVLNTWSQECPLIDLPSSKKELNGSLAGQEVSDIVNQAIKYHDVLIDAYRGLEQAAESDSVKELFANLADLEHNEKLRMVRNAAYLGDI